MMLMTTEKGKAEYQVAACNRDCLSPVQGL